MNGLTKETWIKMWKPEMEKEAGMIYDSLNNIHTIATKYINEQPLKCDKEFTKRFIDKKLGLIFLLAVVAVDQGIPFILKFFVQMGIEFKDKKAFDGFFKVRHHPKLAEFNWWFLETFGEIFVTSGWRKKTTDSGVHETDPLRAEDLRYSIYNNPEKMEKDINNTWIYDPARPRYKVCKLHDAGKERNMHFHIQVHNNTTRRLK